MWRQQRKSKYEATGERRPLLGGGRPLEAAPWRPPPGGRPLEAAPVLTPQRELIIFQPAS